MVDTIQIFNWERIYKRQQIEGKWDFVALICKNTECKRKMMLFNLYKTSVGPTYSTPSNQNTEKTECSGINNN